MRDGGVDEKRWGGEAINEGTEKNLGEAMKKYKNIQRALILPAGVFLVIGFCGFAFSAGPMRTIIDRTGRTVEIPVDPKRIACFLGPSYEKILLLGSADRVVMTAINQPPWSYKIRPAAKKNSLMDLNISYTDPDVEKLLAMGIDLVFYWQWPRQTEKMLAAGIPVVCPLTAAKKPPATMDQYLQGAKDEIMFYGEVLGEKAKKIAAAYCAYYDGKMKKILTRTARIPAAQRPRVYFVTGRDAFGTQGRNSLAYWTVEAAGGTLVSKDIEQYQVEASMEQIIAWDPQVVVAGGLSPLGMANDPRWKGVRAVKEGRVYAGPEGVFVWIHGSSESFLLATWLAKTLHPDRFRDIDMVKELRDYYSRFYHYPLTAEEARLILAHQPPK